MRVPCTSFHFVGSTDRNLNSLNMGEIKNNRSMLIRNPSEYSNTNFRAFAQNFGTPLEYGDD